ncbi:hypothetical protein Patl1_22540 [Pistacia atlantica]|uniref:Uncharacterized protein n=1 Tax=Pistacia atlantica TaxID=434234 RepID=A0ACC1A0S2_9ROSI|nr:hypothetical protein Patl1_22540 [Pistacia atlantica]
MLSDFFRYGMNTSCCRAKILVEYFGEDCGHDKCLMYNSVDGSYDDVMYSDIRRQKFMEKPNLRMFVSKIRKQDV